MSGPTAQFDDVATTYDDHRQFPADVGERLRDAVVARLPAGDAPLLLEIGVGTGRVAEPFVRAGCRYVGLDGSAAMLRRCREKLGGAAGGNLALVRGDMRLLPFPSGWFDAVIAAGVFRPFLRRPLPAGGDGETTAAPSWRSAAIEAGRVLRRPGVLALVKHRPE
ncbi:MAG TPA: class I SAM-dependent methyltransferase, partial [Thermomicrobiales bacterium]|nr:class I SAM-dependent methyltransferase [Thermomicrobiales bacterium]